MTTLYRTIELRHDDAKELLEDRPTLREITGWPSVHWRDRDGHYQLWPKPQPGLTVLYTRNGVPAGFINEEL